MSCYNHVSRLRKLKSAHLFCGILLIPKRYVNKMTQLKMIREISIIQCFQFYDEGTGVKPGPLLPEFTIWERTKSDTM